MISSSLAAADFRRKIEQVIKQHQPAGLRGVVEQLLPELKTCGPLQSLPDETACQLRATLLVRASDSCDLMGPTALEPALINRLLEHFIPHGTTFKTHCPYCLATRTAEPHTCPLLQKSGP